MADHNAQKEGEILFPDQTLPLRGENITVNEFRFRQSLQAQQVAYPIFSQLGALFLKDEDPAFDQIGAIFGEYADEFAELLSLSTGKPSSWFDDLDDDETYTLMMTFWNVNKDFFVKRVVAQYLHQNKEILKGMASPSSTRS